MKILKNFLSTREENFEVPEQIRTLDLLIYSQAILERSYKALIAEL